MSRVNETFMYRRLTADGVIVGPGGAIGGFICEVTGTLTITVGVAAGGATIVNALPVTAGQYHPLPFEVPSGAWADLTTATGTFCILP